MGEDAIAAALARIEKKLDDHVERVEDTYVRKDVYTSDQRSLWDRLRSTEGTVKWAGRTAITALLLPVIVAVVTAIVLSGGHA